MMPVRNHQLLLGDRAFNPLIDRASVIVQKPVRHLVFIPQFNRPLGVFNRVQHRVDLLRRIVVGHEQQPRLHARLPQGFESIGLRRRQRALVPEDNARS